MALDPDIPNRVYLGLGSHAGRDEFASGGGLFYSDDAGDHWHRSTLQNVKVSGIATATGRILVSTFGHGVFVSREPDGTWSTINGGLMDLNILCIEGIDDRLVAGTETGPFYRQVDSGQWNSPGMPAVLEFWRIASTPWDSQLLLAATDSSVWRSDDGGNSWSFSGTGIDQIDLRSMAIGEDGRCWAGSFDPNSNALVYVSADSGFTWISCAAFPSYCAEGVWDILPRENEILVATGTPSSGNSYVYRLVDGESEWEELADEHYRPVRSLLEIPSAENRILAGFSSCGGVIGTDDDGETWSPKLAGLDAGNVFSMAFIDPVAGTIAAGLGFSGTVAIAEDWGDTWTRVDSLFPSLFVRGLAVNPDDSQRIVEAAWNGLYRTLDGGDTWSEVSDVSLCTAVEFGSTDPDMVYAGASQGVIISMDGGETWSEPDSIVGRTIKDVVVDPRNASHAVVAGSWYVFETHDTGAQWDTLEVTKCLSLSFHQSDPAWLYAGTSNGVYVSQDGGATFYGQSVDPENSDVNAIIPDPEDPFIIWAGTPRGIYKSIDGGQTWHWNSDGLLNPDVRAFLFDNATRKIFVGSHSGGVHWAYADATPVNKRPQASGLPRELQVSISPMPCRDQVCIALERACSWQSLDESVHLSLYSLDGRRITEKNAPLDNAITWRFADVPSGMYTVRVSTLGTSSTHPLCIIR